MIKQYVNFYTPKAPPSRDFWSLSSLLLLFILVLCTSVFAGWSVSKYADSQDKRLSILQQQKEELPVMIAEEEAKRKRVKPDPEILSETQRTEERIAEKRQLLGLLNQMQPNVSELGFSNYLYGLAGASQKDAWLTGFDLNLQKGAFLLKGQAKAAESVPPMLNDLVIDSTFSGMHISKLEVLKAEKGHVFQVEAQLAVREAE